MNKLLLSISLATLLLVGGASLCKVNAQMTVFPGREKKGEKPVEKKVIEKEVVLPYDSLKHFYGNNYKEQVGQTFFLLDGSKDHFQDILFEDPACTKMYKYSKKNGVTFFPDYDKLAGKFYYVNRVCNDNDSDKWNECFELIMQEEPYDTIYYKFRGDKGHAVVNVGFATKLKEIYKGKELIVRTALSDRFFHNLETGQEIPPPPMGTKFMCTDAILNKDGRPEIMVLLNNSSYPPLYTSWANIDWVICLPERFLAEQQKRDTEEKAIKQKEAEITRKYGKAALEQMRSGIVRIGWTTEMCKMAWGEPKNINVTTTQYGTTSQWVYSSNRYLYFKGGKLVSIQE